MTLELPIADLARLAVFLDYDGTISTEDVGNHLMARLASPGWEPWEEAYRSGEIGSRECIAGEWGHLPSDPDLLRSVAAEIPLDPGFGPLVADLTAAGARVTIVSDGFGFHVLDACRQLGVPVVTNLGDPFTGTIEFPNARPGCPGCGRCGTCKQRPLEEARAAGWVTVMVGDGISDRRAAVIADVVFATAALAEWCDEEGVPYRRFDRLDEVRRALLGDPAA